jgi:hypothetical protein
MSQVQFSNAPVFWLSLLIGQIVYWDATRHKIGNRKGKKGFLNIPAGAWAYLSSYSLVLIAIIVPLYLFNRRDLIAKAADNPVALSIVHRILIHLLLIAIDVIYFGMLMSRHP